MLEELRRHSASQNVWAAGKDRLSEILKPQWEVRINRALC
jgi:hypothetical protein